MTRSSPTARRHAPTARRVFSPGRAFAALVLVVAICGPAHAGDDPHALAAAGRFPEARDAARTALAEAPADARLARTLQDVLLCLGDRDGAAAAAPKDAPESVRAGLAARLEAGKAAIKSLTAVTRMDGADPRFRLDLARAQLASGLEGAAEANATQFLKDVPDDPEGLAVLGAAQAARGKASHARKSFEQALAGEPGMAAAAIGLALVHAAEEDDAAARKALQDAVAVHPNHPHLLLALARDQARRGPQDPAEFAAALRTLDAVLKLPVPKPDVHAQIAEVHRAKRDLTAAEAAAKAALAIEPNHARAMRVIGFVRFKRGDYEGALGEYRAVALLTPEDASIHADIALVQVMLDDFEAAEASAEQAIDLDKELLYGHLRLGQALYMQGKSKKAKKAFGAVLKLDKEHVLVNRYMGYTLLEEGKPKTAIKHFQKVADALESDSSSVRMIGRCLLDMGKVDEAVTQFQTAIARNEKDPWAYFDLGKGLERQSKWDEAIAAYEQAIANDPKFAYPHRYLAELYDDIQGEPEKALPHYKSYLELGGHDEGEAIAKRVKQLEEDK